MQSNPIQTIVSGSVSWKSFIMYCIQTSPGPPQASQHSFSEPTADPSISSLVTETLPVYSDCHFLHLRYIL